MTLYPRVPPSPAFPSGRYTRTNPLRREFGLRKLTEPLPEALGQAIISAFRRPARYDGHEAIQSVHRQRPSEAQLFGMTPGRLSWLALTELAVSRRVVEAPQASISRETRTRLLESQGVYLQQIYAALARQVGEAATQAEFERLLLRVR
jgi:hypothetical protein